MNQSDFERFSNSYAGAWEMAMKQVSDDAILMAFEILKKYELTDVIQAIHRHMASPDLCKYAPAPQPKDIIRQIDGEAEGRAMQSWTLVEKAMRYAGPYRTVIIADALAHLVIDGMGGWIRFCTKAANDRDLDFQRQEYIKRYQSLINSMPPKGTDIPALTGITERDNNAQGYRDAPVSLSYVGDDAVCAKIAARIEASSNHPLIKYTAQIPSANKMLESS